MWILPYGCIVLKITESVSWLSSLWIYCMSVFNVEILPSKQLLAARSAWPTGRRWIWLWPLDLISSGALQANRLVVAPLNMGFMVSMCEQIRLQVCWEETGLTGEDVTQTGDVISRWYTNLRIYTYYVQTLNHTQHSLIFAHTHTHAFTDISTSHFCCYLRK